MGLPFADAGARGLVSSGFLVFLLPGVFVSPSTLPHIDSVPHGSSKALNFP